MAGWVGLYEGELARDCDIKHWEKSSRALWDFFSFFPRKSRPEQFLQADVEDWVQWKLTTGVSTIHVRDKLKRVKAFFRWLQREKMLDVWDPVPRCYTSSPQALLDRRAQIRVDAPQLG